MGYDEGELDHLGRDAAVEYLLMPERVKKFVGQISALSCDLHRINYGVEKLVVLFGGLIEVNFEKPCFLGCSRYKINHLNNDE